jgi:hypothetical protein
MNLPRFSTNLGAKCRKSPIQALFHHSRPRLRRACARRALRLQLRPIACNRAHQRRPRKGLVEKDAALIRDQFAQRRRRRVAAREDRVQIAADPGHLFEDRGRAARLERCVEYDAADAAAVFVEHAQRFVAVASGQYHITRACEKTTAQAQQLVVVVGHKDGCERRSILHPGSITAMTRGLRLTESEEKTKIYR